MDSKSYHKVYKEVDDIELSTSNNKADELIQELVEPLLDNECDIVNKKNIFEENENKNSQLDTSFSIFNSTISSEATTSQDNIPSSSNDTESSSPSNNQNKCKRSISKAQVNDDSFNDSNSSNEESSKHQKLNENMCNKSKFENKSVDNTQLIRESKDNCSERTTEDVEMRPETEATAVPREIKNDEEGLEIDSDATRSEEDEEIIIEQRLRQLEEFLSSNYSNFGTEQTSSEEESDTPACLKKKKPKPNWFVVPELLHREMGINPSFQRRYYGSLHVVEHFELMYKLKEHEGCVNSLNFNKKGNLLASGSDDLAVVIWDWAIGKKHHSFASGHRSNMFQTKWLPFDVENLMATCARDGQVRLLDIRRGVSRKLATHNAPTHKLALHPDTPHVIVSVGEDAKVLSIDIREEKPTKLLVVKDGSSHVQLYSVHCNPLKSNEFCVGGRSQSVRIYDRRNVSAPVHELCPEHLRSNKYVHVTCALYNYDGTEVLASYNDEDIYLFDAVLPQTGDFAHKYEGHRNNATVKGVNFFGPKSEFVMSGSDCGNIFIWEKNSEAIVNWMPGDEQGVVNCLEPHPHIPIIATSGLDCDVKIWAPSCENPPSLSRLESCVTANAVNRAQETTTESDAFDRRMLWMLLRHIRHTERVRNLNARRGSSDQNQDDDDDDDDDILEDSSDHSDSQSEGDEIIRLQCPPS